MRPLILFLIAFSLHAAEPVSAEAAAKIMAEIQAKKLPLVEATKDYPAMIIEAEKIAQEEERRAKIALWNVYKSWLDIADLSDVPLAPLSDDPKKSEIESHDRIKGLNEFLERLRALRSLDLRKADPTEIDYQLIGNIRGLMGLDESRKELRPRAQRSLWYLYLETHKH